MNDPKWIVRWNADGRPIMLLADYEDGSKSLTVYNILFPAKGEYPTNLKLSHWKVKEEAESAALQLVGRTPKLLGFLSVELCWIRRCKECYDCLCGEGNRKRG